MFQSLRLPQLLLRVGLALVFLWFGISKLIMPQYWVSSWLPQAAGRAMLGAHLSPGDLVLLVGIFEIVAAFSLASGFFSRWFALAVALMLIGVTVFHGLDESSVRDMGLVAALAALVIWPDRTYA